MTTRAETGLGALRAALDGVAGEREIRDLTSENAGHVAARAIRRLRDELARLKDRAVMRLGPDVAERMFASVLTEVKAVDGQATDAQVAEALAEDTPGKEA